MPTRAIKPKSGDTSNEDLGALRLHVDGVWTAHDFANLLLDTRRVYLQLSALEYVVRKAYQYSERDDDIRIRPTAYRYRSNGDILELHETVVSSPLTYVSDVYVQAIRYESPGWIEFLGSLNPMKVIADAITNWREQNRLREHDKRQAILEDKKLKLEFLRVIAQEAKPLRRLMSNGDYERLIKSVMAPSEEIISTLSKDNRITGTDVFPL